MNLKPLLSIAALTIVSAVSLPAYSQSAQTPRTNNSPRVQAEPTTRETLEACAQNRADTLPNPFVDVPRNHWAFKAVLTMHYCGAFREATPRSLIDRLSEPQPSTQPPQ